MFFIYDGRNTVLITGDTLDEVIAQAERHPELGDRFNVNDPYFKEYGRTGGSERFGTSEDEDIKVGDKVLHTMMAALNPGGFRAQDHSYEDVKSSYGWHTVYHMVAV